jgi:hypothetical protein
MLTYSAFIDELRALVPRGKALFGAAGLSDNEAFKRWRHEVTHLIEAIQRHGYHIKCDIQIRRFNIREYYQAVSEKAKRQQFETDLTDTMTELEVLISSFEKFGDPNHRPPPALPSEPAKPLAVPEKVTLAWLWQHAPLTLWITVAAAALAILSSGIALGQSALFAEVVAKLKPPTPPASAVHK